MNTQFMNKIGQYKIPLIGLGLVVIVAIVASIIFNIRKADIPVSENDVSEQISVSGDIRLKNGIITIDTQSKTILSERIITTQAKIDSFTETTTIAEKVNQYFALSADQKALGLYGDAEETILKAIALDPTNGNLHQTYASLLWVADEDSHARREINKAIELNPKEVNFWLTKITYNTGAKVEIMEQIYQNALSATARDIDIVTIYAQFQEKIGNIAKAIELWSEAQKTYPDRAGLYQLEIDRLQKQ